ncbi:MAG TPA: OB-fold domain-containing protein, partial [Trebonia sp.]|nr:OB-fold domain-containing protein [Trebonia sp.]
WSALAGGAFRLQRCLGCGTVRFPLAPVCWNCLSPDCELADADGSGTVATSVVVHRVTSGSVWARHVPYRTGLVDLAAGPRVPGRILCGCGQAARPGTPVRMCRIPTEEEGQYVFAFAHDCGGQVPDGR